MTSSQIAIIGAGLGGAAAGALLQQAGFDVMLYEQAPMVARLGAGIHLGPNVMRVLEKIGIADKLIENGVEPGSWFSRKGDTGEPLFNFPLKDFARKTYGAPYLTVHRGDLQEYLAAKLAPGTVHFEKKLARLEETGRDVKLFFEDGSTASAAIVIGADGLRSKVREHMLGPEPPRYTGVIGHRALFPTKLLGELAVDDYTRWWMPDRNLILYYLNKNREDIYIVTGTPEAEWPHEGSSAPCTKEEFKAAFAHFHPIVLRVIEATPPEVLSKWAFFERDPLPYWSKGRMVLLGDACHPMKPHMGQGAAMAIEDGAMMWRCFEEVGLDDYRKAFTLYEANRYARATKVQVTSRSIAWLKDGVDPFWVYGYNVFAEPLVSAPAA